MPQIYEPSYLLQQGIFIHEIIFIRDANSDSVTMFGAYQQPPADGCLYDRDFGCDFSQLTDLLLLAGEEGLTLIHHLTEMLTNDRIPYDEPVSVDAVELLGRPLHLQGIHLCVYKPMEQDGSGHWVETPDDYYLIDSIKCLSKQEIKVLELEHDIAATMHTLQQSYQLYRQLRQLYFSKKAARKKSGLKDDMLFRLAKTQWQLAKAKRKREV